MIFYMTHFSFCPIKKKYCAVDTIGNSDNLYLCVEYFFFFFLFRSVSIAQLLNSVANEYYYLYELSTFVCGYGYKIEIKCQMKNKIRVGFCFASFDRI